MKSISLKESVSFKEALELTNGLSAEEKLRLIQSLLSSLSKPKLADLLRAIANQLD